MEKYEPKVLVQKAHTVGGHYDLLTFNLLLNELNSEQFDQFCNSIIQQCQSYFENLENTGDNLQQRKDVEQ